MAVSRKPGHRQTTTFWKRVFGQLSRYDLVLTAIPLLFALAFVAHIVFAIQFHAAITAGAVLSTILVADVIYLNPPVGDQMSN